MRLECKWNTYKWNNSYFRVWTRWHRVRAKISIYKVCIWLTRTVDHTLESDGVFGRFLFCTRQTPVCWPFVVVVVINPVYFNNFSLLNMKIIWMKKKSKVCYICLTRCKEWNSIELEVSSSEYFGQTMLRNSPIRTSIVICRSGAFWSRLSCVNLFFF